MHCRIIIQHPLDL